ncbi:copper resistance protein CopC [Bacillus sp. CGMCC 1.16607]|uniref:copper resistance CopC family protein n=1 Tax=Bacillus sp. CGMCC 1.16607 TaxID=3351842 RepID=UPI0036334D53
MAGIQIIYKCWSPVYVVSKNYWYPNGGKDLKQLLYIIILIITLTGPTMVNAHTEIKSSFPQEGQIIDSNLVEISLQFEGEIEELSTMELLKGEIKIPLDQVKVQETQMIGTLSQPLDNGSYTVKWRIAGEDGHAIEGIIPFIVQKESNNVETQNPPTNDESAEQQDDKTTDSQNNSGQNKSNNMVGTISIVVFVLIFIVGIRSLFRRKS